MRTFDYYLPLKSRGKDLKVFYGTLTATDWNKDDEPTEFSLYTIDEADILLGSPHLKKKYLKLLNRPVEVIGERKKNEFGDEYICVKKIKRMSFPQFQLLSVRDKATREFEMEEFSPLVAIESLENFDTNYLQATA